MVLVHVIKIGVIEPSQMQKAFAFIPGSFYYLKIFFTWFYQFLCILHKFLSTSMNPSWYDYD